MRKEAEAVVREHGWTRAAAGEMVQMDSFLKETLRFYAAAGCKHPSPSHCPDLMRDAHLMYACSGDSEACSEAAHVQ